MNLNLDDPLADLLSDNSNDNDSFFESQPGRKKTVNKPPLAPLARSAGGKGKMEDLFGIKEESEPQFKVPQIRQSLAGGSRTDKPLSSSTPKPKPKPDENDDILSDLGFDPKKPKFAGATKSNLFDDILGSLETKKSSPGPSSKVDELSVRRDEAASTRGTISRQSTDTTDNSAILTQPRPKTSTGRRTSVTPPANNAFDLFSTAKEKDTPQPKARTPKLQKKGTTADWLGLGAESEEEPAKIEPVKQSIPPSNVEILKIPEPIEDGRSSTVPLAMEQISSTTEPMVGPEQFAGTIPFLMTTSNLGAHNALQIIEQQESQVALATQMKNQEQALLQMQRRQHDLLSRQDIQFNDLLRKQQSRQNQLEECIKAQQDRINAHIQLLMNQPVSVGYHSRASSPEDKNQRDRSDKTTSTIELEADVKRLELEKLRLEDMLSNISANNEKEIAMMEKSFGNQIKVLEDLAASVESRLQGEIEALHKFYTEKLKSAEDEKQEIKNRLEANLQSLKAMHDEEIRRLKKSQEDDLDAVRDDHRRMLDTIRQSKLLEFAAVQENGSYLETLRMASSNLESVSGDLQTLRTEMDRKLDIIYKERELKLEAREKRIEDSERRFKIIEESSEEEKRRLMDLVASLESQLLKFTKNSSEENWILRQKMASLEAEKLCFEKEKALAREQIVKDEKRVEELKENQLAETQRQMQLIQGERAKLNIEQAKFETVKKLESNTGAERTRLEIDAALKVAQDATRQAEVERERFFKLQRQLESQKRELIDKENAIRFKEEELEQDVALARAKERKASEAAHKARTLEQSFNEKIQFIQQKMRDLSERESRLSQERLNLSQERIDLQNLRTNLEQNKCSLCRIGERNSELSQVLRSNSGTYGIPVIDDNQNQFMMGQSSSAVDRLLDENIAESLERMKDSTSRRHWNDMERTTTEPMRPTNNDESDIFFSKYDPTGEFLRNL